MNVRPSRAETAVLALTWSMDLLVYARKDSLVRSARPTSTNVPPTLVYQGVLAKKVLTAFHAAVHQDFPGSSVKQTPTNVLLHLVQMEEHVLT